MTAQILKNKVALTVVSAVVLLSLFLLITPTHANVGGFPAGAKTATATTTPAVMTPGTGTSTVTYDSYSLNGTNQPSQGVVTYTDSASLLVQFTASTTASKLKIAYEYSQDGIDWYADGVTAYFASTTTGVITVTPPNSMSWTFASTSVGGGSVLANNNIATEILNVKTPTRYVRAVISDTGANAEVWAQFVPKKQQP